MAVGLLISFVILGMWDSVPIIKNTVNGILDPTFGRLIGMNKNPLFGFVIVVAILSLILTFVQRYTTDQKSLKELKKEQKILQEEMKKYKDNPQKLLEMQKKQFEVLPKTMDLTATSILYTIVPMLLLFKWFGAILQPIWGGWWVLWYLIMFMIFSSIFRKWLDVA